MTSNESRFPRSSRLGNYTPSMFTEAYNEASSNDERGTVRSELKQIDSGRWYDVLDEAHSHLARTDLEARANMAEMYSDQFLAWIGVFGLVEDLNTFSDLTGVERQR